MTQTKLHIRSAADLMTGLASPDLSVQLAVLRAIAQNPEQALAYGTHQNRDIVDELIHHASSKKVSTYWKAVVVTLAAFRDLRVVEFFKQLFTTAYNPDIIFMAADRLAHEPVESLHAFLTPMLLQDTSQAQARAAARLLASSPTLSVAEQMRVAMLATKNLSESPPLDEKTAELWLVELDNVYIREAQRCLEAQGASAFRAFKEYWDRLSDTNKAWVLRWGIRHWPLQTVGLLRNALESDAESLVRTAMECLTELPEGAGLFHPTLVRFIDHPSGALRLAAIRAGVTGVDWRDMLAKESDPAVRAACLLRLAQEERKSVIPYLVGFLSDVDWSIRATTTAALIEIGEAVVETAQSLVHHPNQAVRVSAVQILVALGKEKWLEQELLS